MSWVGKFFQNRGWLGITQYNSTTGLFYVNGTAVTGVSSYTWAQFTDAGFDLTVARHVVVTDMHSSHAGYGGSLWYVDPTAAAGYKRQLRSGGIVTTWANRPAVASYPGIVIKVSDYKYASYYSDGTNYLPVAPQLIYSGTFGTIASPTCTYTGGTGGKFSFPGGAPTIPGGMLNASSRLRVRMICNKTGANAVYTVNIYFGTSGDNTDVSIYGQASSSSSTNAFLAAAPALNFTSTSGLISTYNSSEGGGGSAGSILDRSTHVATGSAMIFSVYTSSMNASDSIALQTFNIWHEA